MQGSWKHPGSSVPHRWQFANAGLLQASAMELPPSLPTRQHRVPGQIPGSSVPHRWQFANVGFPEALKAYRREGILSGSTPATWLTAESVNLWLKLPEEPNDERAPVCRKTSDELVFTGRRNASAFSLTSAVLSQRPPKHKF